MARCSSTAADVARQRQQREIAANGLREACRRFGALFGERFARDFGAACDAAEEAELAREKGNSLFKQQSYGPAAAQYIEALDLLRSLQADESAEAAQWFAPSQRRRVMFHRVAIAAADDDADATPLADEPTPVATRDTACSAESFTEMRSSSAARSSGTSARSACASPGGVTSTSARAQRRSGMANSL